MIKKIKERIIYLAGLNFIKDAFILQIGSFAGTFLSFFASVIYARVLGVEIYGSYALVFAFSGIIGLFLDWGTGYTTLTLASEAYARKDFDELKNILTYFLKLSFISFFTVGLIGIIFAPQFAGLLYHQPEIGNLARLVLLATGIRTFFTLLIVMLQVFRKIKYLAVLENINKLFLNFIPIIFVLLGFGLVGIVLGHFLTALGFMLFSLWVYHVFSNRNSLVPSLKAVFVNFNKIKISRYFRFGFTVSLDKNISSFYSIFPILILGSLASPEQVANLKIALAYLSLPQMFLISITRLLQVQLPKAKAASHRDLKSNFYKSSIYSGIAFIFLTIVFLALAPLLINIFYGPEFSLSIKLVYPLSLSTIFIGFMIGFGSIYRAINRMKASIIVNLVNLFVGLGVFIGMLKFFSPLRSIIVLIIYWAISSLIIHSFTIREKLREIENENNSN